MIALLKKELRMLFLSPLAYVVAASFSAINGYVFWILLSLVSHPMGQVQTDLLSLFFGGTFFFWLALVVMVPLVTMRLISEEKKTGSIELLMTAPISDAQIILAKFFSVMVFYVFLWLPGFIYTYVTLSYSHFDWQIWMACIAAVILMGAMLLSLGLMCSSFFSHQLSAGCVCFTLLMVFFLFGFADFFQSKAILKEILDLSWFISVFDQFTSGQLKSKHIVYLISMTCFHLYVTVQILGSRRWKS